MRRKTLFALLATVSLTALSMAVTPAAHAATTYQLTGTVSGDSRPLEGVVVSAVVNTDNTPFGQGVLASAVTNSAGTYRLDTGGAASFRVFVDSNDATGGTSATGYASLCFGGATVCWLGGRQVSTSANRPKTLNLSLPRAAQIVGRVTDTVGRSVAGEPVAVFDGSRDEDGSPFPDASTLTDVNGNYQLKGLLAFDYTLTFGDPQRHATAPNRDGYVASSPAGAGTVTAGHVKRVNASLTANGAFRGRVVDQDGQPLAGASVDTDLDISQSFFPIYAGSTTAADGTFRVGALPPGPLRYCVSKPDYKPVCDTTTYPYSVTIKSAVTTSVPTVSLRRLS